MEEKIKNTVTRLKGAFFLFWVLPILYIVLGETDLIPVGLLVDNKLGSYLFEAACILVTAICVPLSLKLFSLALTRRLNHYTFPVALNRYAFWSLVRIIILGFAVCVNLSGYYLALSTTGLLCACMVLVTSFFCTPSEEKLRKELHVFKEEEEPLV